ncbi:MAG: ferric reductase-like transmembrane domain-containing protein [Patescibacteria group bacterium]
MDQLETYIFQFVLKNKVKIIRLLQVVQLILVGYILYGAVLIFSKNPSGFRFVENAKLLGQVALIFFCITLTSGILRRFNILNKISAGILLVRRHLGITTFLFAFGHYFFMRGIFNLMDPSRFLRLPSLFEMFGMGALFLMSFMFFTSNDISVRKLGKNWNRLHKVVYLIVWLVFFHTILQEVSIYSILIGIYAILEIISHIVNYFRLQANRNKLQHNG